MLYFIKDKSGIDDLKNEIAILNEQKRHLSIVDEFPKYARLDRKIDQLRQESTYEDLIITLFKSINFVN